MTFRVFLEALGAMDLVAFAIIFAMFATDWYSRWNKPHL